MVESRKQTCLSAIIETAQGNTESWHPSDKEKPDPLPGPIPVGWQNEFLTLRQVLLKLKKL